MHKPFYTPNTCFQLKRERRCTRNRETFEPLGTEPINSSLRLRRIKRSEPIWRWRNSNGMWAFLRHKPTSPLHFSWDQNQVSHLICFFSEMIFKPELGWPVRSRDGFSLQQLRELDIQLNEFSSGVHKISFVNQPLGRSITSAILKNKWKTRKDYCSHVMLNKLTKYVA